MIDEIVRHVPCGRYLPDQSERFIAAVAELKWNWKRLATKRFAARPDPGNENSARTIVAILGIFPVVILYAFLTGIMGRTSLYDTYL